MRYELQTQKAMAPVFHKSGYNICKSLLVFCLLTTILHSFSMISVLKIMP